jgi:hypothetical protein
MADGEAELLRFLKPDESAADLLRRIQLEQLRTGIAFIDDKTSLRPGVILEVSGPHGSAKTELLTQVRVSDHRADRQSANRVALRPGTAAWIRQVTAYQRSLGGWQHACMWATASSCMPKPPRPRWWLQFAATCLVYGSNMPEAEPCNGSSMPAGGHVVLLDLDAKFEPLRLVQVCDVGWMGVDG